MLAVPDVSASTLYGMFDLFASAGRDWGFVTRGTPGEPLIDARVVAASDEAFRAVNNVLIKPDLAFGDLPIPDIVCVPEVFVPPGEDLSQRMRAEIAWLRAIARNVGAGIKLAA